VLKPDLPEYKPPARKHYYSCHSGNQVLIWEVAGLWEKSKGMPVIEMPLAFFNRYLDQDFWFRNKPPTLRNFLRHCVKIAEADLSYPIILDEEWRVLDGIHRLVKAHLMDEKIVKVVRFPVTPPPDRVESYLPSQPKTGGPAKPEPAS
jgi:hypothetical protein